MGETARGGEATRIESGEGLPSRGSRSGGGKKEGNSERETMGNHSVEDGCLPRKRGGT